MKRPCLSIYRDRRGEWRWKLTAANGLKIANGNEGYSTLSNAKRAVRRLHAILGSMVSVWDRA